MKRTFKCIERNVSDLVVQCVSSVFTFSVNNCVHMITLPLE